MPLLVYISPGLCLQASSPYFPVSDNILMSFREYFLKFQQANQTNKIDIEKVNNITKSKP